MIYFSVISCFPIHKPVLTSAVLGPHPHTLGPQNRNPSFVPDWDWQSFPPHFPDWSIHHLTIFTSWARIFYFDYDLLLPCRLDDLWQKELQSEKSKKDHLQVLHHLKHKITNTFFLLLPSCQKRKEKEDKSIWNLFSEDIVFGEKNTYFLKFKNLIL